MTWPRLRGAGSTLRGHRVDTEAGSQPPRHSRPGGRGKSGEVAVGSGSEGTPKWMWRPPCRARLLAAPPPHSQVAVWGREWQGDPGGGHCPGRPLGPSSWLSLCTWVRLACAWGAPGAGGGVVRGVRGRPPWTEGLCPWAARRAGLGPDKELSVCRGCALGCCHNGPPGGAGGLSPVPSPGSPLPRRVQSQIPVATGPVKGLVGGLPPAAATGQLGPVPLPPRPGVSCPPSSCQMVSAQTPLRTPEPVLLGQSPGSPQACAHCPGLAPLSTPSAPPPRPLWVPSLPAGSSCGPGHGA